MFTLYHVPLAPLCRKVRIVLGEKSLAFDCVEETPFERRADAAALSPDSDGPLLVERGGPVLADATAIVEYIEERHRFPPLFRSSPVERAETRRLIGWFDVRFDAEVTRCLVGEKILKRLSGEGSPDSRAIHLGRERIRFHLQYTSRLLDQRKWLAGEAYSLADITAGAHLSSLDYIGDVPWTDYPLVKEWYARIKSRPSFRPLLEDRMPGKSPPRHYADLDF